MLNISPFTNLYRQNPWFLSKYPNAKGNMFFLQQALNSEGVFCKYNTRMNAFILTNSQYAIKPNGEVVYKGDVL